MDTQLRKQHNLIQDEIAELQQQVHFCINNYDYHHNNNEIAILQQLSKMQSNANKTIKEFNAKMRDLKETLAVAERKCDEVDELLRKKGLLKTEAGVEASLPHDSSEEKENIDSN